MGARRLLDKGRRSSLYLEEDGKSLVRVYHDTGNETPLDPSFDHSGRAVCSRNRRISTLVYRGTQRSPCDSMQPKGYLKRAFELYAQGNTVEDVAALLNIKTSTAWCYACRIVEIWPEACDTLAQLVDDEVLDCVASLPLEKQKGSLQQLMVHIGRECASIRTLDDAFSHLRLARLCSQTHFATLE